MEMKHILPEITCFLMKTLKLMIVLLENLLLFTFIETILQQELIETRDIWLRILPELNIKSCQILGNHLEIAQNTVIGKSQEGHWSILKNNEAGRRYIPLHPK